MPEPQLSCERAKGAMLELAVSDTTDAQVPAEIAEHLRCCGSCRRYSEGLRLAPRIFGRENIYNRSLRERTLTALEAAEERKERRLAVVLGFSGALTVLMCFVVPILLLDLLLAAVLASTALSLGLSILLVHIAGVIAASVCMAALLRRYAQSLVFRG